MVILTKIKVYLKQMFWGETMSNDKNLYEEYISRINKVQDYIESNISESFSLPMLSEIAHFSPYHFHRIFFTMTGETLFQYIQRIRLEKAAFLLLANKETNVMEISLECGFSNQASFAKAFKNYFKMSASKFRSEKSKENIIESNMGKVLSERVCYNSIVKDNAMNLSYTVKIKTMPNMRVAYIRHTGPYKKDVDLFQKLYTKLYRWGEAKALIHPDTTRWITLFHDSCDLTEDDKLRVSVCMTISENIEVDGEVGSLIIQGGKYAIGRFEINEDQYQDAWNAMFSRCLPQSGYQPDDGFCYELYQFHSSNDSKKHVVDICIPIKSLL